MISLDDVVSHLQEVHQYGEYISARCPFHDDHDPSMMVNEHGFRCQSCGKSGSLLILLKKVRGQRIFYEPADRKKDFSWKIGPEAIWNAGSRIMQKNDSLGFYLEHERKITRKTIQELQIGYYSGWYIIPVLDDSGAFFTAVARSGGTLVDSCRPYSNAPGKGCVYMPNPIHPRYKLPYLLFPFGILDAVTLYQMGYPAATWTAGKFVAPEALDTIRKRIIIIPDRGEEQEALKLQSKLGWRGIVLRLNFPMGLKDPNDFLRAGRESSLRKQIEEIL